MSDIAAYFNAGFDGARSAFREADAAIIGKIAKVIDVIKQQELRLDGEEVSSWIVGEYQMDASIKRIDSTSDGLRVGITMNRGASNSCDVDIYYERETSSSRGLLAAGGGLLKKLFGFSGAAESTKATISHYWGPGWGLGASRWREDVDLDKPEQVANTIVNFLGGGLGLEIRQRDLAQAAGPHLKR